jgi:glutamine amidotransferase
MCIAILSPKGTQLSKESLSNCWLNNYNGAGFMYNDDNNVMRVVKELKDFEKFYKKYENIRKKFPNSTMLIHFRISTHGIINKANCHPFKVNNALGFIHNGVIHDVEEDDKYSDTNMFNRTVLRKIPGLNVNLLNSKGMKKLVGELIGRSKLVFMDNENNYSIILGSTNDNKGHWGDDGVWYSNSSYKEVKDTIDFGGKSVSRGSLGSSYGSSYGTGYRSRYYGNDNWGSSTYEEKPSAYNSQDYLYKVSDGTCTCTDCGIPLLNGELTSIFDECLECVSASEARDIRKSATDDNYILTDCKGTNMATLPEGDSLFEFDNEEPKDDGNSEEKYAECDYCTTVKEKSEIKWVGSYDACLCKSCVSGMIQFKYLDESSLELFDDKEGATA